MNEETLRHVVSLLMGIVEAGGSCIIFGAAFLSFFRVIYVLVKFRDVSRLTKVRLDLGRFLALGLEFQLAADLLRTAVAPSLTEIGKLAAIAAIRTALNYFLEREIEHEREEIDRNEQAKAEI